MQSKEKSYEINQFIQILNKSFEWKPVIELRLCSCEYLMLTRNPFTSLCATQMSDTVFLRLCSPPKGGFLHLTYLLNRSSWLLYVWEIELNCSTHKIRINQNDPMEEEEYGVEDENKLPGTFYVYQWDEETAIWGYKTLLCSFLPTFSLWL